MYYMLIPLGLKATASAADYWIYKKVLVSRITALVISNQEMDDVTKIIKSFKDSGIWQRDTIKIIDNELVCY